MLTFRSFITELSKKTMMDYRDKARRSAAQLKRVSSRDAHDAQMDRRTAEAWRKPKQDSKFSLTDRQDAEQWHSNQADIADRSSVRGQRREKKRREGIKRASSRLTQESEDLVELSKATIGSYTRKANKDEKDLHQVTAKVYRNKGLRCDAAIHSQEPAALKQKAGRPESASYYGHQKAAKRREGLARAAQKLTKEEQELDEADKFVQFNPKDDIHTQWAKHRVHSAAWDYKENHDGSGDHKPHKDACETIYNHVIRKHGKKHADDMVAHSDEHYERAQYGRPGHRRTEPAMLRRQHGIKHKKMEVFSEEQDLDEIAVARTQDFTGPAGLTDLHGDGRRQIGGPYSTRQKRPKRRIGVSTRRMTKRDIARDSKALELRGKKLGESTKPQKVYRAVVPVSEEELLDMHESAKDVALKLRKRKQRIDRIKARRKEERHSRLKDLERSMWTKSGAERRT